MDDYSITDKERSSFILGYYINDDNKMVVNYANCNKQILDYNEENEKNILAIMNKQVENSKQFEYKIKAYKKKCIIVSSIFAVGIFVFIGLSFYARTGFEMFIYPFLSAACLIVSSFCGMDVAEAKSIIKDLEKNKWFQKNEKKINANIRKNNVLTNVSDKTKNIVNDSSLQREIFNINSFNNVPFGDLEQIVENIDYKEEDISKGRTKVRIRK